MRLSIARSGPTAERCAVSRSIPMALARSFLGRAILSPGESLRRLSSLTSRSLSLRVATPFLPSRRKSLLRSGIPTESDSPWGDHATRCYARYRPMSCWPSEANIVRCWPSEANNAAHRITEHDLHRRRAHRIRRCPLHLERQADHCEVERETELE